MKVRKKRIWAIISVGLFFTVAGLFYFFLFTTPGSTILAKSILARYVDSENVQIDGTAGILSEKLVFEDIIISDLPYLPDASVLTIKKLEVTVPSFNLDRLAINIFNGRLKMAGSETIVFYGNYFNTQLDLSVYCKRASIRDILDLFAPSDNLKKISGITNDVDIHIGGSFLEPLLSGTFYVTSLNHNGFKLMKTPAALELRLSDIKSALSISGEISITNGLLSGQKTATIQLQPSKLFMTGNQNNPSFDIKGTSVVEGVTIAITLRGSLENPQLRLTSTPHFAQEYLMLMLATNKRWKGAETSLGQNTLSPDMAADAIDYFLFGGAGSALAKKFGIRDFTVKYDASGKGIGITKEVTDKASITYGIEQTAPGAAAPQASQKIGAGYKITETISVEAEQKMPYNGKNNSANSTPQDSQLNLKYKKEF